MGFLVLGIETSCDDTSLAILEGQTDSKATKLLAHLSFNQELLLKKWGGVVPEIAARNHMEKIVPLLTAVTEQAGVQLNDINLIGVTTYPGLLGPLLTGLNIAKTLALMLKLPIYPVNHLFAHLEAVHLPNSAVTTTVTPSYPYLGLLVSGGHSIYFWVTSPDPKDFTPLGQTIDDAAGEAFDKGGRLLGLPYPAGKLIDELSLNGDPTRYPFPIGLKDDPSCNLSFSGIKTALRNFLEANPQFKFTNGQNQNPNLSEHPHRQEVADLCASYQMTIINALAQKLERAINKVKGDFPIVVGGGVALNRVLREVITQRFSSKHHPVYFVAPAYCTDNGAMVANYAYLNRNQALPYPQNLELDAASRYIEKHTLQKK